MWEKGGEKGRQRAVFATGMDFGRFMTTALETSNQVLWEVPDARERDRQRASQHITCGPCSARALVAAHSGTAFRLLDAPPARAEPSSHWHMQSDAANRTRPGV